MNEGSQSDIGDIRIEDPALEEALEQYALNAPKAKTARAAAKEAKETIQTLMEANHNGAINADDDGVHTGYVICGAWRFRPTKSTAEKKPVNFTPGERSTFQIEDIEKVGTLF